VTERSEMRGGQEKIPDRDMCPGKVFFRSLTKQIAALCHFQDFVLLEAYGSLKLKLVTLSLPHERFSQR